MYTQNFQIVTRRKTFYMVKDSRNDEIIEVEAYIIEEIADVTGEEKDNIAILLAQLYTIQKNTHLVKREDLVIKEEFLIRSIQELLFKYSSESLVEIFEDMKYFEIKEILESQYPTIELNKKI